MQRVELNRRHILNMYRDKQNLNAEFNKPFEVQRDYDVIYTILHRNKNLFKQLGVTDEYGWRIFRSVDSYWECISHQHSADGVTLLREDYRRN